MIKISFSPKRWLLISLIALFVCYCLFQARFLILGPRITIEKPVDGWVVAGSIVAVEGIARNVAWLSLNDRQIFTDGEGRWSERLIVSEGVSIMTVRAKDRFGREREKRIRIIRN